MPTGVDGVGNEPKEKETKTIKKERNKQTNKQKSFLKIMFAYKSIECLHQLLKSCLLFYFIKSLYGISNLESRIKKVKRKAILLLAYC